LWLQKPRRHFGPSLFREIHLVDWIRWWLFDGVSWEDEKRSLKPGKPAVAPLLQVLPPHNLSPLPVDLRKKSMSLTTAFVDGKALPTAKFLVFWPPGFACGSSCGIGGSSVDRSSRN
jgi:hypothetical protein